MQPTFDPSRPLDRDDLARLVAADIPPGSYVNLGIGQPTRVADFLDREKRRLGLDNLILLPFQPFEALPEVLASGDVLMALLEPEAGVFSVPSKILTYLCAGRALLLAMPSENLGVRTVARIGAGLAVNPGDDQAFLAAADTLARDSGMRAACGERARRYAEKTFDIDRIGGQFAGVFATIGREDAAPRTRPE